MRKTWCAWACLLHCFIFVYICCTISVLCVAIFVLYMHLYITIHLTLWRTSYFDSLYDFCLFYYGGCHKMLHLQNWFNSSIALLFSWKMLLDLLKKKVLPQFCFILVTTTHLFQVVQTAGCFSSFIFVTVLIKPVYFQCIARCIVF